MSRNPASELEPIRIPKRSDDPADNDWWPFDQRVTTPWKAKQGTARLNW